jgi:type IV pilus assembly protein PilO
MSNDSPPSLAKKMDLSHIANQFKSLDRSRPANWPIYPQLLLYVTVAVAVAAAGWFLYLKTVDEDLIAAVAQEETLKTSYLDKYAQAVNLDALEEQRKQVQRYVTQLEKQLPNKAEMDALLSDINQAGLGRGLQFDLFKPGTVVAKQYYAELPIDVKVSGRYHDIGQFAADIASLSRIVTLNNITLSPEKDGSLSLSTTVKTFRYLDPDEVKPQPHP